MIFLGLRDGGCDDHQYDEAYNRHDPRKNGAFPHSSHTVLPLFLSVQSPGLVVGLADFCGIPGIGFGC